MAREHLALIATAISAGVVALQRLCEENDVDPEEACEMIHQALCEKRQISADELNALIDGEYQEADDHGAEDAPGGGEEDPAGGGEEDPAGGGGGAAQT